MTGKRCMCWISVIALVSIAFGIYSCSEDPATPEKPETIIKIYAFAGDTEMGIIVIDCTDPSSPDSVGLFDPLGPSTVKWVTISGDYLYAIVDREFPDPNELFVIDISDPVNPKKSGSCDCPTDYCNDIVVSGDYAYVAAEDSGLATFDISEPANPQYLDNLPVNGYAIGVAVSGNYAFVTSWDGGLHTVNIADPSHPLAAGSCIEPFHSVRIAVQGNYAYVVNEEEPAGLYVIDIEPPSSPDSVGFCAVPVSQADACDVLCVDDHAFMVWDYGLLAIDISTPTNPTIVGGIDIDNENYCFDILDNRAYYPAERNGLHIIDISDETSLRILGTFELSGDIYGRQVESVAVRKY